MTKLSSIEPEFVELMPQTIAPGRLYVSLKYATTQHLCACGCGNKVVLPLSPAEWNLLFDGETVTMSPSVGNWEYTCRSHYWIDRNEIRWARAWTTKEIEAGRVRDAQDLDFYFRNRGSSTQPATNSEPRQRLLQQAIRRIRRMFGS